MHKLNSSFKNTVVDWLTYQCIHQHRVTSALALAPDVQKLENDIHCIHHYPVDNAIGFPNTSLPDSDLSGG